MNIDTAIQYVSLRLKEFGYLIFKEYSILVGIQQTEDIIFPSLSYYLSAIIVIAHGAHLRTCSYTKFKELNIFNNS